MWDIVYQVKDSLEAAVLAGSDAAGDDYRLFRATDALAPFAAKDPALARLYRSLRAAQKAGAAARPAKLLDALAMANAAVRALCPSDVPGELTPLLPGEGQYLAAPYSRLWPLIDALTGAGSGRLSVLEEALSNRSGDFGDVRVLPWVVRALGDSNEELADILGAILRAQGRRAVPFLKEGFDPEGRREMERRVYWLTRLAGAEENDWYLAMLPNSKREVREALLSALGLCRDNAALLRELYEQETGKAKDMALRSIAGMKDDESRALWEEELERRPDCPVCLEGVESALAADMAAHAVRRAFSEALHRGRRELEQSELLTLAHAVYAAYGKYSPAMREVWLWCASEIDAFAAIVPAPGSGWDLSAAEMLERCLMETVLWYPCEEVRALCRELAALRSDHFHGAVLLSELLTGGPEVFDRYSPLVVKTGILRRESPAERAERLQILCALSAVRSTPEKGRHIPFARKDALNGATAPLHYRLKDFDPRWAELFSDPKVSSDAAVPDIADPWSMKRLLFRMEWIEG